MLIRSATALVVLVQLVACTAEPGGPESSKRPQEPAQSHPQTNGVKSSVDADWFTDLAEQSGLDFVHFNGASGEFYYPEILGPGVGLLDFDNDGDLDVYLVQGRMLGTGKSPREALIPPKDGVPLKGRLFRNDLQVHADGSRSLRFTDVTDESRVQADRYGLGVAAGDIDNDGWVDLLLTNFGTNQFEHAVRVSPDYARAHYSLGVLAASSGREAEAIERFSTALLHDPNYAEARLRLAASPRRTGRPEESLAHYEQILATNPAVTDARVGAAMALVQLGRYREARDRFSEAMKAYPEQTIFAHGLARLLTAAPDDRVRNGQQAIAIAQELVRKQQRTLDLGETMAMALAEAGRYEEAAALQRNLIAGGEKAGAHAIVRRLVAHLRLYERHEPCRTPWAEDEMP